MTFFAGVTGAPFRSAAAVSAVFLAAGSMPPPAAAADLSGHWVGVLEHGGKTWAAEADLWVEQGQTVGLASYPDGGRFDLPLTGVQIKGADVKLTHTLDRKTVTWSGTLEGETYTGVWVGLRIEATFRLTRVDHEARVVRRIPVRFRHGNVVLAGTMILPPGARPHAAVVWIHGTGHILRAHVSYRMWGHLLARHGLACLLYDKRGVGASTGSFRGASLDDLAGDALAGVRAISSLPGIDASRVGIGGFSQGGLIAPLVLSRAQDLAFVIVVSASGVSPSEQSTFAMATRLRKRGFDLDAVEAATSLRHRLDAFTRTGAGGPALAVDLQRVVHAPWFETSRLPASSLDAYRAGTPDWAFLDPVPLWRRVSVPAFAVWGAEDQLVPAVSSRDLVEGALKTAGNSDATLRVFVGADHDLMLTRDRIVTAREPKAATREPDAPWDWPRIAPELEQFLADWIRTNVTHAP